MSTREPSPYEPGRQHHGGGARPPGGPPPRRSRTRALLPLGVALWAVLELWLLIALADAAGGLTVFALLAAGFVLGAVVIKRAGRRAWHGLAASLQPGAPPPQRDVASGRRGGGNTVAMLGGLLLMLPGLLSDAAGLLCLFPPTARLLRRGAARRITGHRPAPGATGGLGETLHQARAAGEQMRIHRPDGKVVRGEVVDPDEESGGAPGPR
ncbi:FxsA family membrane protein [Streptomyces sp. TRM 70351]|uniref:FxsA family membrane protein n=1 Tax=Streptomyces sp. TRM 70351 TaxID=3116552 RepID=UPI002E7BF841|nr:FxsA family membrane protein [Streptomyces sp. TRM 70351]MEE1928963.1 FxsA family membrane protein [Streptomyces sp. TRM 70351]